MKTIAFQTEFLPSLPVVFGAKDYREFRKIIEEVEHFLTATSRIVLQIVSCFSGLPIPPQSTGFVLPPRAVLSVLKKSYHASVEISKLIRDCYRAAADYVSAKERLYSDVAPQARISILKTSTLDPH